MHLPLGSFVRSTQMVQTVERDKTSTCPHLATIIWHIGGDAPSGPRQDLHNHPLVPAVAYYVMLAPPHTRGVMLNFSHDLLRLPEAEPLGPSTI